MKNRIITNTRPTNMAGAFIAAAVKAGVGTEKVDHQRGTGSWVARRVAMNCERPGFAEVNDTKHLPRREPNEEAQGIHNGTISAVGQVLDAQTQAILEDALFHVADKLVAGRKALLMDEEILGID